MLKDALLTQRNAFFFFFLSYSFIYLLLGKKTNKGKKKKSPNDRYSSISLTQAEVANHVHQMYSEGAPYKKTSAKIRKAAADRSNDDSNQEGTIPENELVKRLNQYPALILNADFQVRSNY